MYEAKELKMKPKDMIYCHADVVDNLRRLPRKMLRLHEQDNITEFVLHELCSNKCFNIKKAAYFIDNPDFDCLKGVVGVSSQELDDLEDIWSNQDFFTQKMIQSPFNQHVRSFTYKSHKRSNESYEKAAECIAHELGIGDYGFYSWDMKHNNHGFFICEKNQSTLEEKLSDDLVVDGLSLLSFCPIH